LDVDARDSFAVGVRQRKNKRVENLSSSAPPIAAIRLGNGNMTCHAGTNVAISTQGVKLGGHLENVGSTRGLNNELQIFEKWNPLATYADNACDHGVRGWS
jgi:hypothetical protein